MFGHEALNPQLVRFRYFPVVEFRYQTNNFERQPVALEQLLVDPPIQPGQLERSVVGFATFFVLDKLNTISSSVIIHEEGHYLKF